MNEKKKNDKWEKICYIMLVILIIMQTYLLETYTKSGNIYAIIANIIISIATIIHCYILLKIEEDDEEEIEFLKFLKKFTKIIMVVYILCNILWVIQDIKKFITLLK